MKISIFLFLSTAVTVYELAAGDTLTRILCLIFIPFLILGWLKAAHPKSHEHHRGRVEYPY